MKFIHHQTFQKEFNKFVIQQMHCNVFEVQNILEDFQRLLEAHFERVIPISPNCFGRAISTSGYEIYWYKLIIPKCNLRKTQFPKTYLSKKNDVISFLSLGTHINNYDDSQLKAIAIKRFEEILELLNTDLQ